MKAQNFLLQTICYFLIFTTTCNAQYNYPPTKTVDSSDTYFGVTYKDPYRWLENMKDTAVISWFKQQANFTNDKLNKIPARDKLIAEWKRLYKLHPPVFIDLSYENGRLFYRKIMSGERVAKLYYRDGMNGKEILLFDPLNYIKGKTFAAKMLPSHDGKYVAIAYTEGGKEVSTTKIMNVDTKGFLPETLYPNFGALSWTFDNKGFLYLSLPSGDNTNSAARLNIKTKLHKLGDEVKNDIDFFSNKSYPNLNIKPNAFPVATLNKDSKNYIFGDVSTVQKEILTYYAPVSEINSGKIQWKILCKPEDDILAEVILGNDVYTISHKDAPRHKLVHTTLTNPDWQDAEIILPEKQNNTLESVTHCRDFLLFSYDDSDGIVNHLYKYNLKTKKLNEIHLPYNGSASIHCIDDATNNCYVDIDSWNKPRTEFNYDAATDKFSPGTLNKPMVLPAAYKNLLSKEVEVKGYDGTMIPLSIIYKKGTKMDGKNICLLEGYGAYGIRYPPVWLLENPLAVKGVVIAITHVRGGGEKGEAWYKGGYKTTKPNTWKDFISCAEYLIAKGYTSPKKLAGTGTSAGGILISRAITERPDLFAAAICNVGVANAIRAEFSANGPVNIPEFGTVKDSIEARALYEMDGVQHVVKGTKYPAVICVTGWNDPRVISWQPGKFAAALQNASSSGKPVLLKVNYDNGHFTEDRNVTYANFADQYAFILWQCGDKDFQPKK